MNTFPNPELVKQWRERIGRFDDAGTTITDFCRTEGYSVASFYQWRRRLRQAVSEPPGFIEVEVLDNHQASIMPRRGKLDGSNHAAQYVCNLKTPQPQPF